MKYPCHWGVKDKKRGRREFHAAPDWPPLPPGHSGSRQRETGPACGIHAAPV